MLQLVLYTVGSRVTVVEELEQCKGGGVFQVPGHASLVLDKFQGERKRKDN